MKAAKLGPVSLPALPKGKPAPKSAKVPAQDGKPAGSGPFGLSRDSLLIAGATLVGAFLLWKVGQPTPQLVTAPAGAGTDPPGGQPGAVSTGAPPSSGTGPAGGSSSGSSGSSASSGSSGSSSAGATGGGRPPVGGRPAASAAPAAARPASIVGGASSAVHAPTFDISAQTVNLRAGYDVTNHGALTGALPPAPMRYVPGPSTNPGVGHPIQSYPAGYRGASFHQDPPGGIVGGVIQAGAVSGVKRQGPADHTGRIAGATQHPAPVPFGNGQSTPGFNASNPGLAAFKAGEHAAAPPAIAHNTPAPPKPAARPAAHKPAPKKPAAIQTRPRGVVYHTGPAPAPFKMGSGVRKTVKSMA